MGGTSFRRSVDSRRNFALLATLLDSNINSYECLWTPGLLVIAIVMYLFSGFTSMLAIFSLLLIGYASPTRGMAALKLDGRFSNDTDIYAVMEDISQSLRGFNNSVQKFGGTSEEAAGVVNTFNKLILSLQRGTTKVQDSPAPIPNTEAPRIMSYASEFESGLKNIVGTVINKKQSLSSLNISDAPKIVQEGIAQFNKSTGGFGNAVIGALSDEMKPSAELSRDRILHLCNAAYEAYARA